jgi:hypothetical protein
MARIFPASILAGFISAAALAGCSAGPIVDQLPGDMGLPKGAPARPETPYQYPAVHDMPPDRPTAPLTEEQQFRLEKELSAVRDRQNAEQGRKSPVVPKVKKVQKTLTPQASQASQAVPQVESGSGKIVVPPTAIKTAPAPKNQPVSVPSDAILVPPAGVKTNP